jgi:hypothetical protein
LTSAALNSAAVANRSAGNFARAICTAASMWTGTDAPALPHRRRQFGENPGDDGLRAAAEVGRLAGQHLVGDTTERIDVASRIEGAIPGGLFGTHVMRRPEAHARLRHPGATGLGHGERDAEVRH